MVVAPPFDDVAGGEFDGISAFVTFFVAIDPPDHVGVIVVIVGRETLGSIPVRRHWRAHGDKVRSGMP